MFLHHFKLEREMCELYANRIAGLRINILYTFLYIHFCLALAFGIFILKKKKLHFIA